LQFLLVINSNLGSISHHFRDTATYRLKIFIENYNQTAADKNKVTINSLCRKSPAPYPLVQLPILTTYRLATVQHV